MFSRLNKFRINNLKINVDQLKPKSLPLNNYFGTYKSSTGLVGLAVDPNGKETLKTIINDILSNVQVY
jgi:hypothetical protein